jgi:hypothetical protein
MASEGGSAAAAVVELTPEKEEKKTEGKKKEAKATEGKKTE